MRRRQRRGAKKPPASVRTDEEIAAIRAACVVAANVLERLCQQVEPGITTQDLEQAGRKLIAEYGAESACYNYQQDGKIYPAHVCLSVNDEVVHGIGSLDKILREGDNITVDVVVRLNGWIGDNARTLLVGGEGSAEMKRLLEKTREAMFLGIDQALPGGRVGDIASTIQKFVEENGYSVVRKFVGHGVGRTMHEEPQVPNYGERGKLAKLYPGMTIAIEPMVNAGTEEVSTDNDGWTARTKDGQASAHFEHTVLITEEKPEILTLPQI